MSEMERREQEEEEYDWRERYYYELGDGKRVIRIDLWDLYMFSLPIPPGDTAADVLLKILEHFVIRPRGDVVYGMNPDHGTYVIKLDGEIIHHPFDVRTVFRDCKTVVELFDGYELAWACIE